MALNNSEIIKLYYQTVKNRLQNNNKKLTFLEETFKYVLDLFIISSYREDKSYNYMQINEFDKTKFIFGSKDSYGLNFFFNNEPVTLFIFFSTIYYIGIFLVKNLKSILSVGKKNDFNRMFSLLGKMFIFVKLTTRLKSLLTDCDFSTQLLEYVNSNQLLPCHLTSQ